jgi:hypothetical protein
MAQRWTFKFQLAALCLLLALPAGAQWASQSITLNPGWNAVFLEVQPEPDDTAVVFDGLPVESVWSWNKQFRTVQYIQDPGTLIPEQPEWLKFFQSGSPSSHLTNLNIITGGRAYLIKLGGSESVKWEPKGRPVYRGMAWQSDSFNLTGFYVSPNSTETFASYFANSTAHAGQKVHELDAEGHWTEIAGNTAIVRGHAYWVYTVGQSEYVGPLEVDLEDANALEYGRTLDEREVVLVNHSNAARTVSIDSLASSAPPGGTPLLAGAVLLSWFKMDLPNKIMEWVPLSGTVDFTVPANDSLTIRLAVRRADFAAYTPASLSDEFLYQSVLRVRDGAGTLIRIPVNARGLQNIAEGDSSQKQVAGALLADPNAGLWFGYVSINGVSEPRNANAQVGPLKPQQTNSEFVFPIIIHVDNNGAAKLLQQVTVMWQDGTTRPDAEDADLQVLDEPGRFVLVSDDSLLAQFKGSTVRDGAQVGKRLSSANFSHKVPVDMAGDFGQSLSVDLTLAHNDPLNPFKHAFHPDHDMTSSQPTVRADGSVAEMYTVTRKIQITFTTTDLEGNDDVRWGDQLMGGTYHEAIIGIHKQIIHVEGAIRLSKVANVGVLNDGAQ